jgi:LPXTG-site transpeptidase (sortase) family protein
MPHTIEKPETRRRFRGQSIVAVAVALAITSLVAFAACGEDSDNSGGGDRTPADPSSEARATPTRDVAAMLRYIAAIAGTPTPGVNAGLQDDGSGGGGTSAGRYQGSVPQAAAPPSGGAVRTNAGALTGPGPILGTDMSLSIPSIGVNATVYSRTVGSNGQMGNPAGAWDVIWYDFSHEWVGLGGYPGQPGANAVFAGHVDYIRVGPAVFWAVRNLVPGDLVTVNTGNGPVTYSIQWSQWADPSADFSQFVASTGQDSITLVTCIGGFSGGHYSNRLIVRGVRV